MIFKKFRNKIENDSRRQEAERVNKEMKLMENFNSGEEFYIKC